MRRCGRIRPVAAATEWMETALDELDDVRRAWRFEPHRIAQNGHTQTFAGALWPRSYQRDPRLVETRLVEVAPGARVRIRCAWQPKPLQCPTVLLVHGLEGSDESRYILGSADKAFAAGWNAVRMNLRNCGGTEELSTTLYHSGMSSDLAMVLRLLVEQEGLPAVAVVGFSLGGNLVLKLAGELGRDAPEALLAIAAVSPAVDLSACAAMLERPQNGFYQRRFVRSLRARIRLKNRLVPGSLDVGRLRGLRSVRDYDDRYIAPLFGFADAEDYYERATSRHVLGDISIPTLVIHADDDPFVVLTERARAPLESNRRVRVIRTQRGGHVAFVSRRDSRDGADDAFWAENRVVEFINLMAYNRARSRPANPQRVLAPY